MHVELYECTNPDCENVTSVETWSATLNEPADSTHGDGCSDCGDPLQQEPVDDFDPDVEEADSLYDMDREDR